MSIIQKEVIASFPLIKEGLSQRISHGQKVRVGFGLWFSCGNAYSLPQGLVEHLHRSGQFTLNQLMDQGRTDLWGWGQMSKDQLEIDEGHIEAQTTYIVVLHS